MILEAHASLEAFLRKAVFGRAPMPITFDVPTKPWATALRGPAVNCFLYDVRENQMVKHTGTQPMRDSSGRITARRPVPRYMDHCYLITGWAPDVKVQHKIISGVLGALLTTDTLPRDVLVGALAEQPRHVVLSVAQGAKRGMLLSLGGEQRLAIELELSVPWSAGADEVVQSHVETSPRIEVRQAHANPMRRRMRVGAGVRGERSLPIPVDIPGVPQPEPQPAAAAAAAPAAPVASPTPTPQEAASRMLGQFGVRLLQQLQAAAAPPADGAEPPAAPTQRSAAQVGAQVGARVAAMVEATAAGTAPADPQSPPSPLGQNAARAGAQLAARMLAQLQGALNPPEGTAPTAVTPQQAGQLGARAGAQLAAHVVQAAADPAGQAPPAGEPAAGQPASTPTPTAAPVPGAPAAAPPTAAPVAPVAPVAPNDPPAAPAAAGSAPSGTDGGSTAP